VPIADLSAVRRWSLG